MATYNLSSYFADQPLPGSPTPGVVMTATGSVTPSAALTTSDTTNLFRVPAGHRVIGLQLYTADADSGTTVTVNIGTDAVGTTYDDADAFAAAAATLVRVGGTYNLPVEGATGTANPATWWTNSTPNVDYNVQMVLAAGPATSAALIHARIWYANDVKTMYDPTNSPSVVTS